MSEALHIERDIHVPGGILFDLWTQAEHLDQWYCRGGTAVSDPKPGGARNLTCRLASGEERVEQTTYEEVEHGRQFSASNADGSGTRLEVVFNDTGGSTRIALTHTGLADAEALGAAERLWNERLDALIEYLSAI